MSVNDWNRKIIEEFRENDGRVGGMFAGAPMVLLHTIGARSGEKRVNPLVYFPGEDGTMTIVASAGGAPRHPAWYHNLRANPRTEIEVGTERVPVVARELEGEERATVWKRIVAERPGFGEYQEKAGRVIPVVELTRA
jgi:deazaflavin-dependent oxidoreductase (nitroreductase family)